MFYKKPEGEEDIVCLWSSFYDAGTKVNTIELKFLNSSYADKLAEVVDYYILKHVDLIGDTTNEYYDFMIADYYNDGQAFSGRIRKSKIVKVDSWVEFILMPLVNFSVSVYSNKKAIAAAKNAVNLKYKVLAHSYIFN